MATNYQRVIEFHLAVDGEVPDAPRVPSAATIALRRALVAEECAEVAGAFDRLAAEGSEEALVALCGELADLLYVVYGTFVACGVDADRVFAEVHVANLRKTSGPRRSDGKQLKPEAWEPPDLPRAVYGP